ncbi:hypothetical protein [Micromonospora sp. WMMD980]|uniref:hypothetical protein n=1 Tax=Micromonospora sp. WMMD980 TaxID=3016088 RepID=UPI002415FE57|nr:hypothetical protein [Micromonospora sp. WMMD980]MDG4800146.1 hypothetical protein [Micromonospora sp. WMMD980]
MAGALPLVELARQLHQSERVAGRLGEDPAPGRHGQPRVPPGEQPPGGLPIQRVHGDVPAAGTVKGTRPAGPHRAEETHLAAGQPPCDEAQHLGTGQVDPVQVIEDQQRLPPDRSGEQGQGCRGDRQPIRWRAGGDAEDVVQHLPLGR